MFRVKRPEAGKWLAERSVFLSFLRGLARVINSGPGWQQPSNAEGYAKAADFIVTAENPGLIASFFGFLLFGKEILEKVDDGLDEFSKYRLVTHGC